DRGVGERGLARSRRARHGDEHARATPFGKALPRKVRNPFRIVLQSAHTLSFPAAETSGIAKAVPEKCGFGKSRSDQTVLLGLVAQEWKAVVHDLFHVARYRPPDRKPVGDFRRHVDEAFHGKAALEA